MTAHELARLLLAGPDHRVAIAYDGQYLAAPTLPDVVTSPSDLVVIGVGESMGVLPYGL